MKGSALKSRRMLIPMPDLVPHLGRRPWFRTRHICFTMADWRIIGDALRLACPYARYYRRGEFREYNQPEPPDIKLHDHICDLAVGANEFPWEISISFDPDWTLEFVHDGRLPWRPKTNGSEPYAYIRPFSSIYPARSGEPERVVHGELYFATEPNNENHKAFQRDFFALLGRYSSNRHHVEVWTPGYEMSDPMVSTKIWFGHEAIRWALEDPRRVLAYGRTSNPGEPMRGHGYRPVEEKWRAKLG